LSPDAKFPLLAAAEWYYQKGDYEMYITLQNELAGYENNPDQKAGTYCS
jgi:hypothetical protein